MGFIEHVAIASFGSLQRNIFTLPQGFAGVKGIFIRGANLSKCLIEGSDSRHQSTIPCRDIITQGDPIDIHEWDFFPLNWRLPPNTTISFTPTTSSATVAHIYVLWAQSLSEPEIQVENALFDNTAAEPFDTVTVPDDKTMLLSAFLRGPDLEQIKFQVTDRIFNVPGRNVAVAADPLSFTVIEQKLKLPGSTKLKAIAVTHGTGGNTDLFASFIA